ncbi:MAG: SpaH/EbpB family LPXTG-anchored major pilin, partial [Lachnospiraceae bacterium]|nr:SpaH/EbpB family LPXTG-anchored major pilin [Lachnospiraceae bacterium]
IYKVVDKDGMDAYYSANPTALPGIDTYVENGKIKNAYASNKVGQEIITGADGLAKFENLELGFYVVIETTKPAAVTEAVAPFLVSVPMTTVDGEGWLYDVHVIPKNGTTYGGVTLEKTGKDGAKLEGVTFVLQKYIGDPNDVEEPGYWETITKASGAGGDNTGADLNLVTNKEGIIKVEGLSQGTYRFIETSVGNNNNYIMDGKTTYEFTVTDKGTVIYNGTEASDSVKVAIKNEKPDVEKQVTDKDGNLQDPGKGADYSVGDKVPYTVTIDVPANIVDLKTFKITDTPTNLKDDINTIKVKCDAADVASGAYKITESGNGFVMEFTTAQMADYAGKKIVVTYEATLLEGAVSTPTGNGNKATLEYSNNILPENDPDNPNTDEEPKTDKIEDSATVFTFKVQILKKAESENGKALEGVEFDLYREAKDGETGVSNAADLGLPSGKSWVKVNTDPLVTDANGEVSQSGLANGTYYLVELKTNEGYNLLKAPVKVELKVQYTITTKDEYTTDENGQTTLIKHEVEKVVFTGATDNAQGIIVSTVINKQGFTLPSTGGMGTFVFTFVGIAMMAAAVILFFTSKKKEAK